MSIVVEEEQFVNLDDEFVDSTDTPEEAPSVEATAEEEQEAGFEVPTKFKDKSMEEVVQSYQQLEKEFGRKNNEIGELRKLTDQMLELQLKGNTPQQEVAKKEVDFDSLIDNPSDVVNSLVDENPTIKKLEQQLTESARQTEKAAFEAKHPDAYETVQNPDFQQWIQESPVRQQMFREADSQYNYQMADELFTLYGQIKGVAKEASSEKRDKALKAATVEKGTPAASSKKIFRRADLMKLRLTDPDRYEAMEPEIILAYQEKRVR
jgi:hypothetical protein